VLAAWVTVRIVSAVRPLPLHSAALLSAVFASAAAAAVLRSVHGGLPPEGYGATVFRLTLVWGTGAGAIAMSTVLREPRQVLVWAIAIGLGALAAVCAPTRNVDVSPGLRSSPLDAARSVERAQQPHRVAVDAATAPDVVLLTIDTWRADTLGLHPDSIAPGAAPTLERWASRGQFYSAALAPVPLTGPSHAAMLSGRAPWTTSHLLNGERVDGSIPWVPETLQAAGYRTAAFVGSAMLDGDLGFARGFEVYDDDMDGLAGWRRTVWSSLSPPRRARDQRHERWERRGEQTLERIERWLDSTPSGSPVFLWVHLYEPHAPYEPVAAIGAETLRSGVLPGPSVYAGHPSFGRPERKVPAGVAQLLDRDTEWRAAGKSVFDPPSRFSEPPAEEELAERRDELLAQARDYLGEIARSDELAGQLERVLDRSRSERSRTWVVVGDHGESLTEHHEYASHQRHAYQANVAVPLLVLGGVGNGPSRGSTVEAPVSLTDVAGTLVHLSGLDPGGYRALPTSSDPRPDGSAVGVVGAIVSGPDHGPRPGKRVKAAAWDGRYKLIAAAEADSAGAWEEWYDTRVDPAEANVLDPASLPEDVTGRLRRTTADILGRLQSADERGSGDLPRSVRDAMRALGYVEP